MLGLLVVKLG